MTAKRKTSLPPPPAKKSASKKKERPKNVEREARLRAALEASGLANQAEVSRQTGFRANTISDFFGGYTVPNEETLKGVCRLLNISTFYAIWGGPLKEFDESEDARAPRKAVNPGVRQWLTSTLNGKSTTKEEKDWLYSIPWPSDPVRAPDLAYEHARQAFRELHSRNRR